MEILATSGMAAGALVYLLGAVWITVAIHRSRRRRIPTMIAALGLVAANAGVILYQFADVGASCDSSDPVFLFVISLVYFGVLGLLAGTVWAVVSRMRRRTFRAPVVLAGLAIVGILQAVILLAGILPFCGTNGHGYEAETEWHVFQTAMDILMADQAILTVERPPANTAQNDFSALPKYTGGTVFLGGVYMKDVSTTFFYCWDESGRITGQYDSAQQCPSVDAGKK